MNKYFDQRQQNGRNNETGRFLTADETLISNYVYSWIEEFANCGENRVLVPYTDMGFPMKIKRGCIFSTNRDSIDRFQSESGIADIELISEDFLCSNICEKFNCIIAVPPFGQRTNEGRSDLLYLNKCLNLLEKGGRLVILLQDSFLSFRAFRGERERIINEYSLETILPMGRVNTMSAINCSLLVIDNKKQSSKVYLPVNINTPADAYNEYIQGISQYCIDSFEIVDRFDASYYDPKYKEIRNIIKKRDTVRLGEISDIQRGVVYRPENCTTSSEDGYLVIRHSWIRNGEIEYRNEDAIFCSKEFINSSQRNRNTLLKNGDVLIRIAGIITWAIYRGEDEYAVANHNIAIIRSHEDYDDWLRLFFNSKTGIRYLESQLKIFSHNGFINTLSISDIHQMAVPDKSILKGVNPNEESRDLISRVSELFKNLGWDVREEYRYSNKIKQVCFDIALFSDNKLNSIVEVKSYSKKHLESNSGIWNQLDFYKHLVNDVRVFLFIDNELYEYLNGHAYRLPEIPRPYSKDNLSFEEISNYEEVEDIHTVKDLDLGDVSVSDSFQVEMLLGMREILRSVNNVQVTVNEISQKIDKLSEQIMGYQSLVNKQLEMAESDEERERIVHAFSEECTERIIKGISSQTGSRIHMAELQKLKLSLGESAWNKLDDSSKTFLVSSKVIFNDLVSMGDIVDYSGVCLLVTKALEVEVSKRFCKNFVSYLKETYPGKQNYIQYPTALLDKYGKPVKSNHFTLGSVAYVLCLLKSDDLTEEKEENNKNKLLEYAKAKVFSGKTDEEILELLLDYAESIEEVKKDYRNPSAHTNELKRVDAEQCFDLVLDVEKLLKQMLDSFVA